MCPGWCNFVAWVLPGSGSTGRVPPLFRPENRSNNWGDDVSVHHTCLCITILYHHSLFLDERASPGGLWGKFNCIKEHPPCISDLQVAARHEAHSSFLLPRATRGEDLVVSVAKRVGRGIFRDAGRLATARYGTGSATLCLCLYDCSFSRASQTGHEVFHKDSDQHIFTFLLRRRGVSARKPLQGSVLCCLETQFPHVSALTRFLPFSIQFGPWTMKTSENMFSFWQIEE